MLFTISEEEGAEMYLGNTPIEVDLSTAIYMLQQKDNMPEGMAWGNYFPAVINHTSSAIARKHPDFHAANMEIMMQRYVWSTTWLRTIRFALLQDAIPTPILLIITRCKTVRSI